MRVRFDGDGALRRSFSIRRAPWRHVLSVTLVPVVVSSCAFRTAGADHYVGPILYRTAAACPDGADTTQVVSVGAAIETGRQWGLSLGFIERVAASPRDGEIPCSTAAQGGTVDRRWHVSAIYVRFDHDEPPRFVHRSVVGAQAVAGLEANALSIGAISATLLLPPPDAYCNLRYDARDPTGMHFTVWRVRADHPPPEREILEEIDR